MLPIFGYSREERRKAVSDESCVAGFMIPLPDFVTAERKQKGISSSICCHGNNGHWIVAFRNHRRKVFASDVLQQCFNSTDPVAIPYIHRNNGITFAEKVCKIPGDLSRRYRLKSRNGIWRRTLMKCGPLING